MAFSGSQITRLGIIGITRGLYGSFAGKSLKAVDLSTGLLSFIDGQDTALLSTILDLDTGLLSTIEQDFGILCFIDSQDTGITSPINGDDTAIVSEIS